MNWTSIAIGAAAIGFGLFAAYARHFAPHLVSKLGHMQQQYGNTAGYVVHFVAYSLIPIVIGATALYMGFHGRSFL
ncbi:hypothetical protein E4P82_02980 [Candidatus Competibacter phosphatis]|uniref:DUF423 domain-containing protein n=1 Tax=Candidatus Competibacter phosphatis TaxID=221280 RepID=A0ABX1THW2_9GAMM|nr:hypothetical protein [Candidatus Competibacter phosphatis]NMQ18249.1 hypothetical protein [Candidatus Competibacter phosphatis]